MAPFGIEIGVPPPDTFSRLNSNYAYADVPPKPHPSFAYFSCFFDDQVGVAKIDATSNAIENDEYGDSARAAFQIVEDQLVKKYGIPTRHDFLKAGAIWAEPRDWMNAIRYQERTFAAAWIVKGDGAHGLSAIVLSLECVGGSDVKLSLTYESNSWPTVLTSIRNQQADVL